MPSDQIFALPFEQQIGQFFFIGLPGTELDSETRDLVEEIKPGGVILFGRNVASPEQVRGLLDGVRALSPMAPLCGIDQEGGLVDRLREVFPPMPSARAIGDVHHHRSAESAHQRTLLAVVWQLARRSSRQHDRLHARLASHGLSRLLEALSGNRGRRD